MTTPTEFVLWLNGATAIVGDEPTAEQWATIKEKLNEALGHLAAKKLLERAEEQVVRDRMSNFGAIGAIGSVLQDRMSHNLVRQAQVMGDLQIEGK